MSTLSPNVLIGPGNFILKRVYRVDKWYSLGGRTWRCLACGFRAAQSGTVSSLYSGNNKNPLSCCSVRRR